jgi:hypothetical protein
VQLLAGVGLPQPRRPVLAGGEHGPTVRPFCHPPRPVYAAREHAPGKFGDVKFHPTEANQAIAGDYAGKAYYSTNGGESWTPADLPPGPSRGGRRRVELAYAVKKPDVVFASVDIVDDRESTVASELWRSNNGGKKYERQRAEFLRINKEGKEEAVPANWLGGQGWLANAVWAADENRVLLGGLDLWRSTDGGQTLKCVSRWWEWYDDPNVPHADQHVILGHPDFGNGQNNTVYVGNDGGIFMTPDAFPAGEKATRWVARNTGYHTLQLFRAAGHDAGNGKGTVLAGAQDNGTWLVSLVNPSGLGLFDDPFLGPQRPDAKWDLVGGGDGGFCAIDPNEKYLFYQSQGLKLYRRTWNKESPKTPPEENLSGDHWDGRQRRFSCLASAPCRRARCWRPCCFAFCPATLVPPSPQQKRPSVSAPCSSATPAIRTSAPPSRRTWAPCAA